MHPKEIWRVPRHWKAIFDGKPDQGKIDIDSKGGRRADIDFRAYLEAQIAQVSDEEAQ
jgi:hypothetical protein